MPKAIFITPDDQQREVEVANGVSLMRAALSNSVDGIVGDCGGTLSCATCHVLVEPEYLALLPAITETEEQMLEYTVDPRTPASRLSCQIFMGDDIAGIKVRVAEHQV